MAGRSVNQAVERLRRAALQGEAGPTDGQLLECFIASRDEAAFQALLRRHGPMVWGVCRRVLRHEQDAEDAFQAAFLVLARKAATVAPREMVGNWLYGVACRTAVKARGLRARLRAREKQVTVMPDPMAVQCEDLGAALRPVLDRELSRLPDKYRAPVVLCDLEGKTQKATAQQLGWPEGTVSSRLARARALLARRLTRCGLGPSAGAVAAALPQEAASAGMPTELVAPTVQAAGRFAAGQAAAGVVSAEVVALTERVLQSMTLSRITTVAVVVLMALGFTTGTGLMLAPASGSDPPEAKAGAPVQTPKGEAIAAESGEISDAYLFNEALGDEKFTGKQVAVTGHPYRIMRSASSRTRGERAVAYDVLFPGIQERGTQIPLLFHFVGDEARKQLANVKRGQQLTIEGLCEGRRMISLKGGADNQEVIYFHNCKIVNVEESKQRKTPGFAPVPGEGK
jgi:RNA polymerase sigma factor (sigma-70 family)